MKEEHEPIEILPGNHIQSEEELLKAAGEIGTTIFHPVGTCAMSNINNSEYGDSYNEKSRITDQIT